MPTATPPRSRRKTSQGNKNDLFKVPGLDLFVYKITDKLGGFFLDFKDRENYIDICKRLADLKKQLGRNNFRVGRSFELRALYKARKEKNLNCPSNKTCTRSDAHGRVIVLRLHGTTDEHYTENELLNTSFRLFVVVET